MPLSRTAAVLLMLSLVLCACAGRPNANVLKTVAAPRTPEKTVTVYAATNRARAAGPDNAFTAGRAAATSYARYTIAIPPTHQEGRIEWPKGAADPQKSFAVVEQASLSHKAFTQEIADSAGGAGPGNRRIGIFVHGFNYNYQEGLFRLAQMAADTDLDGAPVLFSWPSQATVAGYLADRESVTYSRDALTGMLIDLSKNRPVEEVILFGHSMGGWLVMEALRQLKLEGRDDVLARLQVVLAAPDIDPDVFRAQLAVIGPMATPIAVLVSKDDIALKASSLLAGDLGRVGALDVRDPKVRDAAEKEGVQIVDISAIDATDGLKHDRYVGLAHLLPKLSTQRETLGRTGSFVLDAVGQTISSPFRLASQVINP